MSIKSKTDLQALWVSGYTPTQIDFGDLFETVVVNTPDGTYCETVSISGGYSASAGNGGGIALRAGSGYSGGSIEIHAGNGSGTKAGDVLIWAGSGAPSKVEITTPSTSITLGSGGDVAVSGSSVSLNGYSGGVAVIGDTVTLSGSVNINGYPIPVSLGSEGDVLAVSGSGTTWKTLTEITTQTAGITLGSGGDVSISGSAGVSINGGSGAVSINGYAIPASLGAEGDVLAVSGTGTTWKTIPTGGDMASGTWATNTGSGNSYRVDHAQWADASPVPSLYAVLSGSNDASGYGITNTSGTFGGDIAISGSGTTSIYGNAIILGNIPTSDPAVAGQLWNDNNTLKISAGQ